MKRFAYVLFFCLLTFPLSSCTRISINNTDEATLRFVSIETNDDTDITQTLTGEETHRIKSILTAATYDSGGAGCPFDENISISFGNQVYAIAYDDCNTVLDVNNENYYTLSQEGMDYIVSLFEKYVGYFPNK